MRPCTTCGTPAGECDGYVTGTDRQAPYDEETSTDCCEGCEHSD